MPQGTRPPETVSSSINISSVDINNQTAIPSQQEDGGGAFVHPAFLPLATTPVAPVVDQGMAAPPAAPQPAERRYIHSSFTLPEVAPFVHPDFAPPPPSGNTPAPESSSAFVHPMFQMPVVVGAADPPADSSPFVLPMFSAPVGSGPAQQTPAAAEDVNMAEDVGRRGRTAKRRRGKAVVPESHHPPSQVRFSEILAVKSVPRVGELVGGETDDNDIDESMDTEEDIDVSFLFVS